MLKYSAQQGGLGFTHLQPWQLALWDIQHEQRSTKKANGDALQDSKNSKASKVPYGEVPL